MRTLSLLSSQPRNVQIVDQVLVATRYPLSALWFAEIFGVAYLLFDILWDVFTPGSKGVIYAILDWDNAPVLAVLYAAVALVILVPLFVLLHHGLFRCGAPDFSHELHQCGCLIGRAYYHQFRNLHEG